MTSSSYWTRPEGPWIHIGDLEFEEVAERARRFQLAHADSAVGIVRVQDPASAWFMQRAIAAAFRFPPENIDRLPLRHALSEFGRLRAAGAVLVITDCSVLLRYRTTLAGLSRVLDDVGWEWSDWPEHAPKPFHTVLLARSSVLPNIEEILVEGGVRFDRNGADVFGDVSSEIGTVFGNSVT